MPKALSSPNIALIKYWGNRNNELRLPAADSLSITLDTPTVEVTVEPSDQFRMQSFDARGMESMQTVGAIQRLMNHWKMTKEFVKQPMPDHVSIVIRSAIPPAIGIASSAAVFSCLAEAYAALVEGQPLSRQDVSIIGRLGSGSGARNVYGGFVALENHGEGIESASARSIADEKHWPLHDIIIVPSIERKKVGSTEGHARAGTSPLFAARLKEIPRRMKECISAIETKDFEKLRTVSEEDALDMHRVMETQDPPLHYLSDETRRILKEIEGLRVSDHLNVLYTMDAGPTVHLICTEDTRKMIEEYAAAQKGCLIFKTKIGRASRLV